jgi:hypothetical protein
MDAETERKWEKAGNYLTIGIVGTCVGFAILMCIVASVLYFFEEPDPNFDLAKYEAEQLILERESIPDKYSFKSIGSFCGVIFLIICVVPFKDGIFSGMGANGIILGIVLIFWILGPSMSCTETRYISKDGGSSISVDDPNLDICLNNDDYFDTNIDGKHTMYNFTEKYYAMHCPDYEGVGISPKFFHPGAFIFIPFIFCFPLILVGFIIRGRFK